MPRSRRGSGDLRVPWRVVGALLAVTLLSYLNCLGCGFVFDDVSAIKENKDLRPSSPLANGSALFRDDDSKCSRLVILRINHPFQPILPHRAGKHLVP